MLNNFIRIPSQRSADSNWLRKSTGRLLPVQMPLGDAENLSELLEFQKLAHGALPLLPQ